MNTPKNYGKNYQRGFDFFLSYQDKELGLRIAEENLSTPGAADHFAKTLGVPVQAIMGLSERLHRWIWED